MTHILSHSTSATDDATFRKRVLSGDGFSHLVRRGERFRIVDIEGNQAVDTMFYSAEDPAERYSATDTIVAQRNLYLGTGTQLMSIEGRPLLTIVADTCGRHDTLGGACAAESNQVRYALDRHAMHNCRDTFLLEIAERMDMLSKRDIASNVNFFMNVPVTPDGSLEFADGVSGPGRYVEMRAEMDVYVLISNCPQLNNPCNAYNPTPIEVMVFAAEQS